MADTVDTSSYPKPQAPVNVLDVAGKLGGLEQQRIGIDLNKLKLVNEQWGLMHNELANDAADPNITVDKVIDRLNRFQKNFSLPPGMIDTAINDFKSANSEPTEELRKKTLQRKLYDAMQRGQSNVDKVNDTYGVRGQTDTGQVIQPTVTPRSPVTGFGTRPVGPGFQQQVPPTAGTIDEANRPRLYGPQGAPTQMVPAPQSRLPIAPNPNAAPPGSGAFPNSSTMPPAPTRLTVTPGDKTTPPIGTTPVPTISFTQANPQGVPTAKGPATGFTPLYEEGRKQYTADQELATQKSTALIPVVKALPMLEGLTTGPLTPAFNKAVATLSNIGVIPKGLTDKTAQYQEVNKYLAQYVQQNGTRSDADLASRELSSPNVGTQINPALVKLTRNAIAQDRVQIARVNAFEGENFDKYGKFRSGFPAGQDPRAFVIDTYPAKERSEIMANMLAKKSTLEGQRFWRSLKIAVDQKLIDPSLN